MRQALKLHPDLRCTPATCIDVEVARPRPGHLVLRSIVTGQTSDLRTPAVIEEASGGTSYWALAHPPGKADFHHPDGFVHELRTVERP